MYHRFWLGGIDTLSSPRHILTSMTYYFPLFCILTTVFGTINIGIQYELRTHIHTHIHTHTYSRSNKHQRYSTLYIQPILCLVQYRIMKNWKNKDIFSKKKYFFEKKKYLVMEHCWWDTSQLISKIRQNHPCGTAVSWFWPLLGVPSDGEKVVYLLFFF